MHNHEVENISFLQINFNEETRVHDLSDSLNSLRFFETVCEWHRYRLENIVRAGLDLESAPAKSIIADREKHGVSFFVRLDLAKGGKIEGQLRNSNLLFSSKSVDLNILKKDPNVQELLAFIEEIGNISNVEYGP